MPLVRIALRQGKPPDYLHALQQGIYRALRETFGVPEHDRFALVTQHAPHEFFHDPAYLGIAHGNDLVIVQLTVSDTRTLDQKKALYARIVELLAADPGVRREDVFINLVEVRKENWSFGNGIAQYA